MYSDGRKKQRGQWRKLGTIFKSIDSFVPYSSIEQPYEHFHVPNGSFIQHRKTSGRVKTAFICKWIETAESIISQKPHNLPFCKVVAILTTPNLCGSQIVIFYDESYFGSFWVRYGPEQIWTIICKSKNSPTKARNISTVLPEICYHEVLLVFDEKTESEIWFYGDHKIPDSEHNT